MKTMMAAGLLAALSISVFPCRAGANEVGVGVILGSPIGGTAKLWLDDRTALDVGLGSDGGDVGIWGDALWHDWTLLPQPASGRLGLYVGAGPQIRAGDDPRFGIRAIGGLSYRPAGHPLELFAEVGPLFELTQDNAVDVVGGAGLRVLLGSAK